MGYWKNVLIGATIIGAASLVAYAALHRSQCSETSVEQENVDPLQGGSKTSKKKRNRRGGKKGSPVSTSSSTSGVVNESKDAPMMPAGTSPSEADLATMLAVCDKPIEELLELAMEPRQNVFYALLMKGEMLMAQGESGVKKAVGYFAKAVALVPSPGEVLAALEKALPQPAFALLLKEIQSDVKRRTSRYFASICPANGAVRFEEPLVNGSDKRDARSVDRVQRHPVAAKELAAGELLWEEAADMAILCADHASRCHHCLRPSDNLIPDQKVEGSLFCSEACQQAAYASYQLYLLPINAEAGEALQKLRRHCQQRETVLPLFLLRYVGMLLTEEIKGNGASANGPFAHFDNLPQVYRPVGDDDAREARWIRSVFTKANENLAEFLTDDIYTAMKATLERNLHLFGPATTAGEISIKKYRVIGDSAQPYGMALFHLAAHLAHAEEPNCQLSVLEGSRLQVHSIRTIAAGEPLTVNYVSEAIIPKDAHRPAKLAALLD